MPALKLIDRINAALASRIVTVAEMAGIIDTVGSEVDACELVDLRNFRSAMAKSFQTGGPLGALIQFGSEKCGLPISASALHLLQSVNLATSQKHVTTEELSSLINDLGEDIDADESLILANLKSALYCWISSDCGVRQTLEALLAKVSTCPGQYLGCR